LSINYKWFLGLELARLADLPQDVITEGRRVAEHLARMDAQNEEESESSRISRRRKAFLRVTSFKHTIFSVV
jgi:DNA mismatch repair protein MSH4